MHRDLLGEISQGFVDAEIRVHTCIEQRSLARVRLPEIVPLVDGIFRGTSLVFVWVVGVHSDFDCGREINPPQILRAAGTPKEEAAGRDKYNEGKGLQNPSLRLLELGFLLIIGALSPRNAVMTLVGSLSLRLKLLALSVQVQEEMVGTIRRVQGCGSQPSRPLMSLSQSLDDHE